MREGGREVLVRTGSFGGPALGSTRPASEARGCHEPVTRIREAVTRIQEAVTRIREAVTRIREAVTRIREAAE